MRNVLAATILLVSVCCTAEEPAPLPPLPPLPPQPGSDDSTKEKPVTRTESKPLMALLLKDGKTLRGSIISETAEVLVLRQEDGKLLPVPIAEIAGRTEIKASTLVAQPNKSTDLRGAPAEPKASNVADGIVVPPDILAKAELGDAMGGDTLEDVIGAGGGEADTGAGRGSFGSRNGGGRRLMVMRHGGSRSTEATVESALKWLAAHQEADGHWDAVKYAANQKTDTACTSLALLAFLSAGHTEKVGQYKENVRRGIAWLKSKQNANGLLFDETDAGAHRGIGYPHAIAGLALAEAAGMARVPDTRASAQKAIDYSTGVHQQGEIDQKGGFRYQAKQAGDLSVTGWYTMQLKSAKVAGLKVSPGSFEGIIKFLDSVEKKGTGADKGFGAASSYAYTPNDAHENTAHRLTAIGNLCRQFLGWKKEDLQASVAWFVEKGGLPDAWGEGKTDLYYWYYGTLCVFQQGGDLWKQWNEALKKTLCENQKRDGDEAGSWDPVGEYAPEWGRVGQTALCCLCLEVYYRYLPIYKQP